jgi:hypothetical protein
MARKTGLIKQNRLKPECVLEIGSSARHRLNYLKELYPSTQTEGIDPSSGAVNFRKEMYPQISLHVGTADFI